MSTTDLDQLEAPVNLSDEALDAVVPHAIVVLVSDQHVTSPKPGPATGDLVVELLQEDGFEVDGVVQVGPKKAAIKRSLETAVIGGTDLVVTIGGVGVGPSNKTPDATRAVIDQIIPGIAQAVRSSGLGCGAIDAATSRGIAGVSASTVIVNLAPSRAAVRDGMATIGPLVKHCIAQLQEWSCDNGE